MKTPIEMMLDGVEWIPSIGQGVPEEAAEVGLPYETHHGILVLAPGCEVECIQLNDGRRLMTGKGYQEFLKYFDEDAPS